jgi:O-antigen/teichoic acid export membrane protein
LNLRKYINNISSLQFVHFLRFTTFLLISIVLTKSPHLTTKEIGDFEMILFLASAVSFFWVTALIQSFMPLYNNNSTFHSQTLSKQRKSPEIFNAFLLLVTFSFLFFLFFLLFKRSIRVFGSGMSNIPYVNLLLIYILVSNPVTLIEYIYILRNKSYKVITYGVSTYVLQFLLAALPIFLGFNVDMAIWGLIIMSVLRFIWLIALLKKYAEFKISLPFIKEHLYLGFPLIISTLLSGSAQYIDGLIVSLKFDASSFAVFRYGAKELPLVVMLANGLSNGMLHEFSNPEKISYSLEKLKTKSKRLMHWLFPISIVVLFFAKWLYPALFNMHFNRSSDIFMVYLLLIISRLVFPQTILIAMKQTRIVLIASIIEIILNVTLSLLLIPIYGLVGVALATVVVYVIEKILLISFTYFKLKIKPAEYIPLTTYFFYVIVLTIVFVLIDHRIIILYYHH